MGIVEEDIRKVRDATDIVAVISEHVALKRVGRRWQGLCPFHAERTPSFSVNPTEGFFYCFGCHAKGDAITFVREIEHLDFVGAVERLAQKANVQIRYDDGQRGSEERRRRARLQAVMEQAVEFYHQRLLSADDAAPARGYLRSRGYDGDVVRKYRIGWAPDGWDVLARHLDQPDDVMADTGLAFRNKRNKQQDAFRARVMFPIFDPSGAPVAFGGRVLPGGDGPKYKNSTETRLYQKSSVLYGLNWAKTEVVNTGEAVVCEGYTDVIGLALAGVERGVATCGTALTAEHLRVLKRFASRVVFAFDADAAGQAAAERVYQWEQELELEVRVAALPAGADPGDLARTDPGALRAAVESARPFLGFRVERALAAADLSTPEGRARGADLALEMIREHPSDLVRDQYVMTVADRCRLDADRLRQRLAEGPPVGGDERTARRSQIPPTGRAEPRRRPPEPEVPEGPEVEALRLVIHERDATLPLLDELLFDDERCVTAFRALATAGDLRGALEVADPAAAALLHRLAVEEPSAEPDDVAVRLGQRAVTRSLHDVQRQARGSGRALDWADTVKWLKVIGEDLSDPEVAKEAMAQLVSWLRSRAEELA